MTPGNTGSRRKPTEVACLGESMVMMIPRDGRLDSTPIFEAEVGGAESNVAVWLAALGVRVRWLSRVGADPLGVRLLRTIRGAGVDVSEVEVDPLRPTGVYFKDLDNGSTDVYYYRRGSAASAMSPGWLSRIAASEAAVIHITGITAALSLDCMELLIGLVEAPPTGARISFDVNWRPALWRDRSPKPLSKIARMADIVFVGDDEAGDLWGKTNPRDVRSLLPEPGTLVVKQGAWGASVFQGEDMVSERAIQAEVVDSVGAGDAFAAGFLYGTLRSMTTLERLRMGHILAASSLVVRGDIGRLPSPECVSRLLSLETSSWSQIRWTKHGVRAP